MGMEAENNNLLLLLLPLVLLLVLVQCPPSAAFRIGLTHVDSNNNDMTVEELAARAADRSKRRMALVQSKRSDSTVDIQDPIFYGGNVVEYYMRLTIGTPPTPITAVMDTGSTLVWTHCQPCDQCDPQNTSIYDPLNSSTFLQVPCDDPLCQALGSSSKCSSTGQCNYTISYADNSNSTGYLGYETFTLGDSTVNKIGFGCAQENKSIVGLGQGDLSLISQLNLGRFSYCLSMTSTNSLLLLGPSASLNESSTTGAVQSTPFLSDTSYYYISLQGISLGSTLLPIPDGTFQYNANGTGGTIIDSGSSLTWLQKSGYDVLKQEIISLVDLPVVNDGSGYDLCFQVSSWPPPDIPDLTLHLDGADMTVPQKNYMYASEESGTLCMLIGPTDDLDGSIIGNSLQENIHILYDLDNRMLSFVPAQCDQL